MTERRRRILPHRRTPSAVLAARRTLDEIQDVLSMTIVVRSIEGVGPVRIQATLIYGQASAERTVEGPTEAAALANLAREAVAFRGADEQWLVRYGLGMG